MEESPLICGLGAKSQLRRRESSNGERRETTNTREAADRAVAHQRVTRAGVISDFVFESMKRISQRAQRYGETRRRAWRVSSSALCGSVFQHDLLLHRGHWWNADLLRQFLRARRTNSHPPINPIYLNKGAEARGTGQTAPLGNLCKGTARKQ
jgi:hypothetical protein